MTLFGSSSPAPAYDANNLESRLLLEIAALKKAATTEAYAQCEQELHEIMMRIRGPQDIDLTTSLVAVLSLGNVGLAAAALATLGNLDGQAVRAIPAIARAGLSGNDELLVNASCALGSIRDRASLLALVEICEQGSNYNLLVDYTVPEFARYDEECEPFISRVETALSKISPEGALKHIEILNALRVMLRHMRAKTYQRVDLPDQVDLDPLAECGDKPTQALINVEKTPIATAGNPVVDERFLFIAQYTRSNVGLQIHRLTVQDSPRYLVLIVEDDYGYGAQVADIIDCLACVIGDRYELDPRFTYWGVRTTRDSGLTAKGRDEYTLHILETNSRTGRYHVFRDFSFESMDELLRFLNASRA
jgi:hypothetical protein